MATGFGEPHIHLDRTDSTNERLRELAIDGAASGTVVTAGEQSAGRGRLGRQWVAPPGSALLFSALLRPLDLQHLLLPIAVPIAVCEAIESLGSRVCRIKWPNDIWTGERKVAGILIEARPPEWAVIGVGINLSIPDDEFPDDVRWPATSVGEGVTPDAMREALCAALGEWVEAPAARVLEAFAARDALRGREIAWVGAGSAAGAGRSGKSADDGSGSGVARGIDERGNLVVELGSGERRALGAGEVSLRL